MEIEGVPQIYTRYIRAPLPTLPFSSLNIHKLPPANCSNPLIPILTLERAEIINGTG